MSFEKSIWFKQSTNSEVQDKQSIKREIAKFDNFFAAAITIIEYTAKRNLSKSLSILETLELPEDETNNIILNNVILNDSYRDYTEDEFQQILDFIKRYQGSEILSYEKALELKLQIAQDFAFAYPNFAIELFTEIKADQSNLQQIESNTSTQNLDEDNEGRSITQKATLSQKIDNNIYLIKLLLNLKKLTTTEEQIRGIETNQEMSELFTKFETKLDEDIWNDLTNEWIYETFEEEILKFIEGLAKSERVDTNPGAVEWLYSRLVKGQGTVKNHFEAVQEAFAADKKEGGIAPLRESLMNYLYPENKLTAVNV